MLRAGEPIPDWFAFSSVIAALRQQEQEAAAREGKDVLASKQ